MPKLPIISTSVEEFNNELTGDPTKIVGLVLDPFIFNTDYAEDIASIFTRYELITGIYSDNKTTGYIPYPSFYPDLLSNTIIINSPFFVRSNIDYKARSDLKTLVYYDFIKKTMQTKLYFHVPKPVFSTGGKKLPIDKAELSSIV